MIREYFALLPYILVAIGYPMSVYYFTQSFEITLFFAFGFLLVSFSMMLLVWLPASEIQFPSNTRLSQSSFSSSPIAPKKKYRAEDVFSSNVEPNRYAEKRFQEDLPNILPPIAPKMTENRPQNYENRPQNYENRPQLRPESQVLRIEIVDLSTPKRENIIIQQENTEEEEIIMNKKQITEVLEESFKEETANKEGINLPKERRKITIDKDPFGYCHDCKKVQPIINEEITEITTTKGIKRFIKGNCQICGRVVKGLLALRD